MKGLPRYRILAKRKNKKEPWADWTSCDDYERAKEHARYIEEAGYLSKVVDRLEDKNDG